MSERLEITAFFCYIPLMKTVLITAGGTSEPIDNIRSITNTGTGALGSLIADAFAKDPQVGRIIYVHGRGSVLPKTEKAECIEAAYTQRLLETMRKCLIEDKPDAIVHSMAVSDYCVKSVVRSEDLPAIVEKAAAAAEDEAAEQCSQAAAAQCSVTEQQLLEASAGFDLRDLYNKIPSSAGNPVIFLQPTPKVIPEVKKLAPETILVGFKLLDDVAHEELISVAERLMKKNDCDFVLANDYTTVKAGQHTGYLMDKNGGIQTFVGKPAIAEGIAKAVATAWK